MTLVEAAELVERLQRRAAVPEEFEALQQARDALLVIVSEGFASLTDRHDAARGGPPAPLDDWFRGGPGPRGCAQVTPAGAETAGGAFTSSSVRRIP